MEAKLLRWPWPMIVFLMAPTNAAAHDLGIECVLDGTSIKIRAFFDDGTRAAKAKVRILDAASQTHLENQLDQDGTLEIAYPPDGTYQVVVDAGQGHKKTTKMVISRGQSQGRVSEGPGEAEFVGFPYFKVIIGLGALFLFALGAWIAARTKANRDDLASKY